MLRELLKLMADKGLLTISEASSELGVSKELVKMALEHLKALGLVEEAWPTCPAGGRCGLGCPIGRLGRAFRLTEAGVELARPRPVIVRPKKKGA